MPTTRVPLTSREKTGLLDAISRTNAVAIAERRSAKKRKRYRHNQIMNNLSHLPIGSQNIIGQLNAHGGLNPRNKYRLITPQLKRVAYPILFYDAESDRLKGGVGIDMDVLMGHNPASHYLQFCGFQEKILLVTAHFTCDYTNKNSDKFKISDRQLYMLEQRGDAKLLEAIKDDKKKEVVSYTNIMRMLVLFAKEAARLQAQGYYNANMDNVNQKFNIVWKNGFAMVKPTPSQAQPGNFNFVPTPNYATTKFSFVNKPVLSRKQALQRVAEQNARLRRIHLK